jgi:hypothetical protein
MMDDIIIIDDAIPEAQQQLLEKIFTDFNLQWNYVKEGVDYTHDSIKTNYTINSFQYVHSVYADAQQKSPTFSYFTSLLSAIPFTFKELLRIKVNSTSVSCNTSNDTCGAPHTDFVPPPDELLTAIYYINDSDGDTFIFNESFGSNTLSIKQRIKPKRGRLVVFNGKLYHSGNYPTTDKPRIVANINFFPYIKS